MTRASIAALVTYHDERELLTECLQSLLAQPERPEEILVYDDASRFPAKDYVPAGAPVRVLRGERNGGPSFGRNQLLAAATTDFVHFHDADDWFDAAWSARVRAALAPGDVDAVFTEVASHRDGKRICDDVIRLHELAADNDLVRFCLLHSMLVPSGTYRRQLLTRLGGYRTELWQSEDYEFHVRIAAAEPRTRVLTDPLVHIRLRPESRSQNQREVWTCRLQALRLLFVMLPPTQHRALAEAVLYAGSKLFRLGARTEARGAFRLARSLHVSGYDWGGKPMPHRIAARWLGPEAVEWIGLVYRRVVPDALRTRVLRRR